MAKALKLDSLIAAFGRAYGAGKERAPVKVQQRLYDAAMRKLAEIARRHPERDASSAAVTAELWKRGEEWWNSRAMRGPGVDW